MDELRTMLREGARKAGHAVTHRDLETVSVDDIMVPRNEIVGIDIDSSATSLRRSRRASTRLPVFKANINVIGMLHLRRTVRFIQQDTFSKADLLQLTREPYFVPKGTPLHTQLFNFQKQKRRIALVVDEYGDIQGIVTLRTSSRRSSASSRPTFREHAEIHPQTTDRISSTDALIRDVNRALGWHRRPKARER
jgi:Mg2+/Co2+ transporter CorB